MKKSGIFVGGILFLVLFVGLFIICGAQTNQTSQNNIYNTTSSTGKNNVVENPQNNLQGTQDYLVCNNGFIDFIQDAVGHLDLLTKQVGTIEVNVLLLDTIDKKCIDENYTLNYYIEKYNKVKNYFYNQSFNKLTVNFNFYNNQINESSLIFNTYELANIFGKINEFSLLEYFDNAKLIYGKKCDKAVKIVQYACLTQPVNDKLGWPHTMQYYTANIYDNFIIVPHVIDHRIICHEFLHVLKCKDLYFKDSVRGSFADIMACDYTSEETTNAYYKNKLGWIDESSYEDNICTGVEKINKDGRYKIYMPDVKNQTITYKFGETLFENFYIETRSDGYRQYLIVNRINQAVNHTNCTVISSEKDKAFFLTLAVCQNGSNNAEISNTIKYSNGNIAPYSIGNIYYGSNYIEFDFCTSANFNNLGKVQVVDANNQPVKFVEVYLNNKFVGLSDNNGLVSVSLIDNYELKFVKGNTSTTYKIDNPNFKLRFMQFTFNETQTYAANVNFFVKVPPNNIYENYYYVPPQTNFNIACPTAYNSITNSWEDLYYYGYDVNTNVMPVYMPTYYSKVRVEYQNYYETNSVIFEINNKRTYYTTIIKQSFIQDGFDFIANLFK